MRKVRIAAAAAVAAALAAAPAAQADNVIIENIRNGCYGVGIVVCKPQVTELPVGFGWSEVPVCVRTCQYVDVLVPESIGGRTCVAWSDQNGNVTELCA